MRKPVSIIAILLLIGIVAGCTNKDEAIVPTEQTKESNHIYETFASTEAETTQENDAEEMEPEKDTEATEESETVAETEATEDLEEPAQQATSAPTDVPDESGEENWVGSEVEIEF